MKLMKIAHPKAFQTPKIGLTGMGTWIIQTTAKTTGRQTMNEIWNWTTLVRNWTPELRTVCAARNVFGLIWPILRIKKKIQQELLTVNIMETRSTKGIKKQ
jgi:uncharacterized protein (DUF2062 family)